MRMNKRFQNEIACKFPKISAEAEVGVTTLEGKPRR
jgi:hypothetical protein